MNFVICPIVHAMIFSLSLNYFSCIAVVGFTWYIYFWLSDLGGINYIMILTYPHSQSSWNYLVINHSSSEKRNIFVPRWLKLSCVLVVLQLACYNLHGYLWHCSKWTPLIWSRAQQYMSGLEVLACSINTNFNHAITNAPQLPLPPPPWPLGCKNL